MMARYRRVASSVCGALLALVWPAGVAAQAPSAQVARAAAPATQVALPPADSPPLVRTIEIAFPAQGNVPSLQAETYLYYISTRGSQPSQNVWVPYDEQAVLADFRRLWATGFLDDLSIDVTDVPYENGVIGKHITYNMEDRDRVRIVEYLGSDKLNRAKIEEVLIEIEAVIQLDTFIDSLQLNKVKRILRELLAEDGYHSPEITQEITAVAGGPKRVRVVFNIVDGPQTKIDSIVFVGNEAITSGTLRKQMKANIQPKWWPLSWFSKAGTYKEHRFAEDADAIIQFYRGDGYVNAQVGQPELRNLRDSENATKRWVELRIPVSEGRRYRLGDFTFEGITILQESAVRDQFHFEEGDYYDEQEIREGLERVQALYGSGGYMEFVGFPDLSPHDQTEDADGNIVRTDGPAVVDVTMRMEEGEQYFINRITFVGNTTTRDHVIRRELRMYENGVFNTEMLKLSVRRINQLGYFLPIEDDQVEVDKTDADEHQVDVKIPLEEQNRNQISFGAGVSQFEGFFGQLSYTTTNFLGRGEVVTFVAQSGSRAQNYQIGFTEPFLFDRPISAGFDVFKRQFRFIGQFTQRSAGANVVVGLPIADFSRLFLGYGYEQVAVLELNPLFEDPRVLQSNPFLADSLLIGLGGSRTVSKITPSFIHNTIDNPVFPNTGRRLTASLQFAGLGGNTNFYKPRFEGIWYFRHLSRTSVGLRTEVAYVSPFGGTQVLPIFERFFLGGEYSIRGFDLRTVGPQDQRTGLVIGGNKSLLFNFEYLITLAQPARLIMFYDTGQVQSRGNGFALSDFKTSTGVELRFMMPVLNAPFRLIFGYNVQRGGVLDNSFQPEKAFNIRFAIGTSF